MYEMHFGVPMRGAVLNTINTRLDARTVAVLLRHHSGSKLVFVDPASLQLVRDALKLLPPEHPAPRVILVQDPNETGLPADDALTYEGLLKTGDPEFAWVRPASEWDPMILNYSSGTTAAPKGVVHCHRGTYLNTTDWLVEWTVPRRPTYLWTLTMFHANGWGFTWGMAAVGGTNVCMTRHCRHGVRRRRPPRGDPPLLRARRAQHAGQRVRGRAPAAPGGKGAHPHGRRAEELGFEVSHGYGLTETAGLVVSCTWKAEWDGLPDSERARLKTRQGVRTMSVAEVDVVDSETGRSVHRDGATAARSCSAAGPSCSATSKTTRRPTQRYDATTAGSTRATSAWCTRMGTWRSATGART
jgi:acyl-CoA synthetase (AMP-forming)/AMP-acid ligase II